MDKTTGKRTLSKRILDSCVINVVQNLNKSPNQTKNNNTHTAILFSNFHFNHLGCNMEKYMHYFPLIQIIPQFCINSILWMITPVSIAVNIPKSSTYITTTRHCLC